MTDAMELTHVTIPDHGTLRPIGDVTERDTGEWWAVATGSDDWVGPFASRETAIDAVVGWESDKRKARPVRRRR